jgi:hypothetical protein
LIIRDFSRGFFARLNVQRVSVFCTKPSKFAAFAQVGEPLEREKIKEALAWICLVRSLEPLLSARLMARSRLKKLKSAVVTRIVPKY